MPKKCEIHWLAAGDLTLSTRPESRRKYEACQSDSKMQDQLIRVENGITLSAYTLEKLSRSMWNKPEARSRTNFGFGKFSFDKNAVSLNLSL
jgi:hypothetical protein